MNLQDDISDGVRQASPPPSPVSVSRDNSPEQIVPGVGETRVRKRYRSRSRSNEQERKSRSRSRERERTRSRSGSRGSTPDRGRKERTKSGSGSPEQLPSFLTRRSPTPPGDLSLSVSSHCFVFQVGCWEAVTRAIRCSREWAGEGRAWAVRSQVPGCHTFQGEIFIPIN